MDECKVDDMSVYVEKQKDEAWDLGSMSGQGNDFSNQIKGLDERWTPMDLANFQEKEKEEFQTKGGVISIDDIEDMELVYDAFEVMLKEDVVDVFEQAFRVGMVRAFELVPLPYEKEVFEEKVTSFLTNLKKEFSSNIANLLKREENKKFLNYFFQNFTNDPDSIKYYKEAKQNFELFFNTKMPIPFTLNLFKKHKLFLHKATYDKYLPGLTDFAMNFASQMKDLSGYDNKETFLNALSVYTRRCLNIIFLPRLPGQLFKMKGSAEPFYLKIQNILQSASEMFMTRNFGNVGTSAATNAIREAITNAVNIVFEGRFITLRVHSYINSFIKKVIVPLVDRIYLKKEDVAYMGSSESNNAEKLIFEDGSILNYLFNYGGNLKSSPEFALYGTIHPLKEVSDGGRRMLI
jgi:hypothetical protein